MPTTISEELNALIEQLRTSTVSHVRNGLKQLLERVERDEERSRRCW